MSDTQRLTIAPALGLIDCRESSEPNLTETANARRRLGLTRLRGSMDGISDTWELTIALGLIDCRESSEPHLTETANAHRRFGLTRLRGSLERLP